MKSPAVSGAANYKELCIAAKNEERRMASLKKREQYHKPGSNPLSGRQGCEPGQATTQTSSGSQLKQCFARSLVIFRLSVELTSNTTPRLSRHQAHMLVNLQE